MKNFKQLALALAGVVLLAFTGHAMADYYDMAEKSIAEFPTSTAAPASGDWVFRYVAADNKVEKIDATAGKYAGAFNGTVGATTPGTGAFTTITASSTLGVTGVTTATGGLVSIVSNDFGVPVSTGILANPVQYVTKGTCSVAAVNGGTCIPLVAATGRTISVVGYDIIATGSAATCTGILLEDTNGTPVVASTIAAAALTSGAHNFPGVSNNVLGVGFGAGSGLTISNGLQIIVNGSACTTTTSFSYQIEYSIL